ncbi:hypothetical protein ACVZYL_001258 [Campylobacter jejuni]
MKKRKFIIVDTQGYEQYTRNMAIDASVADIWLSCFIDVRKKGF